MPPDEAANGAESRGSFLYHSLRSRRSNRYLADALKPASHDELPPLPQQPQLLQQQQLPQPQQHALAPRPSRRGLRHIFSRSKLTKDQQKPEQPPAPTPAPSLQSHARPTEPYTSHIHIPPPQEQPEPRRNSSLRASSVPRSRSLHRNSRAAPPAMPERKPSFQDSLMGESLAAWEMPQLFKAFPQTIRQATLPAVTMPTEMVLRLHEKNALAAAEPVTAEDEASKDKLKKKHGKNPSLSNLQWTTKIYLLVTSGYLLQYSGTGSYDRLPEKVLQLSQTSAAFVTDSIPGKHWVLQVSSTTEPEAAVPTQEHKSFLSKLSMLAGDKRDTSNILMVFDSPGDMDSWMVTLRGEIERLGGKRKMSETGVPERPAILRRDPSRTMVVRDSRAFSQSLSCSPVRRKESRDDGDVTLRASDFHHSREQSLDDLSTTNSVVSQDGRQLDNLRDSNGNRLSFASADRRTAVTSAASSPEGSPIAETFPRNSSETCDSQESDAKPRPNASSIASRRSVLQTSGLFIDVPTAAAALHEDSSLPKSGDALESSSGPVTPNFSVPQSSSRRFSHVRISSTNSQSPPSPNTGSFSSRPARSKPPPALRSSRPLSMVVDHQSPKTDLPFRPPTADGTRRHMLSPVKEGHRHSARHSPHSSAGSTSDMVSPRTSVVMPDGVKSPSPSYRTSPRRSRPPVAGTRRTSPDSSVRTVRVSRRLSALPQDMSGTPVFTWADGSSQRQYAARAESPSPQKGAKRVSTGPTTFAQLAHRRHSSSDEKRPTSILPPMPPPPSGPLPAVPAYTSTPKTDKQRALANRRSLPQMMPPPAPPPLRELPPIPPVASLRV